MSPGRFGVSLLAAAASLALPAAPAGAAEIPVADASAFKAALARAAPGDVLRLADGVYPPLEIAGRTPAGRVRIVGSPATRLDGLVVRGSRNISVENVTISPSVRATTVSVDKSSQIEFTGVRFLGNGQGRGIQLDIGRDSSQIRVVGSEFTACTSGRPCLQPGGRGITVLNSRFHDCFDCDMVRGGGSDVTFSGNTFERALRGSGTNHNDLIQIMGGGPWTIIGNRFGERHAGAAQVYVNPNKNNTANPIHDVTIASNIFTGDMIYAIRIAAGEASGVGVPRGVRVVNNTILSGRSSAVLVSKPYETLAVEARPLLANNIFGVAGTGLCARARTSRNLVVAGQACANDVTGSGMLDPDGVPTSASVNVINRGDPAHAPDRDFRGRLRIGAPDIGAVEFGGTLQRAPVRLVVPPRLGRRTDVLRAGGWKLTVPIQVAGVEMLRVRLLVDGRERLRTSRRVASRSRVTLSLTLPIQVREARVLVLELRANGNGKTILRRVRVHVFR